MLLLLCLGCAAGAAVYLANQDSDPDPGAASVTTSPTGVATSSPASTSSSCTATSTSAGPDIKAVGPPDFDGAPRAGKATMRITTNRGDITIAMDRAATPCTVASFQHLAAKRFFDGTSCHRLVTEGIFVLQCGDPSGTGRGGPDYQFGDENLAGATYTRGVVAMANAGAGTNGSQFFIVFRDSTLSPAYTPFGTVTAGLDIVEQIAAGGHDASSTAGGGQPKIPLTFETVTVD
ncbi:peptidylprolyl isomerase [Phytohabitans rumicis]|uniref:Peptidyl-prolyl cis-trans isomerase n=1 Tax=Phytohabitans rumicis TaxID=1076125 RepID=A0A6V8LQV2_9ACTN|nr:peptidylprolyl isomerase [Phytohabitans rumicis]GFJ95105.1 hypothetical protein Prum_087470 [Phytohabitans rumicis]